MAKKKSLSDLVPELNVSVPQQRSSEIAPEVTIPPEESSGAEPQLRSGEISSEVISPPEELSQQRSRPKYLSLVRKEVRFREDQIDQLTRLSRQLNRKRLGGERITENTIIRVAVDFLMANSSKLEGTTEKELTDSLMPTDRIP